MLKLKNSFAVGLFVGLLTSGISLVVLDLIFYLLKNQLGYTLLATDVVFALSILGTLFVMRKFISNKDKQQLGLGMVLSLTIWGLLYIYFFYMHKSTTIFF